MRLIDADTLNYVRVRIYHDDGTIGGYNAVVPSSEIKNSPTVEAIPVIRCKDCKKFVVEEEQAYCLDMFGQCDENGFCSWAERKDNEID